MCLLPYYTDPAPQGQAGCFPGYPKFCVGFFFSSPIGQRHWDYYAALARFMVGIDDLEILPERISTATASSLLPT